MTKAGAFPTLSTARLLLRAPRPDDATAFRAILLAPGVTRFSNWPDRPTQAQCERFLRWMSKLHSGRKGCGWMIESRESGRLAGAIRYNRIDRKWKCAEIGYELHPELWGQGLMTEAAEAAVACGHEALRINRIEAWTLPGNPASDRVLEKVGFRYEGTLRQKAWFKGAFHDFRMFGRLAAQDLAGGRGRQRK